MVFHVPLESASQSMVHCEPSLKTAPGPGAVGLESAPLKHRVNTAQRLQDGLTRRQKSLVNSLDLVQEVLR